MKCPIPPEGWVCSRGAGHEGPCAATPSEPPITRVELIDHTKQGAGREFVRYYARPVHYELSIQDDFQTLKIFVSDLYEHLRKKRS